MVMEQGTPSKAALLDALRSSERELLTKVGALPAEQLEQGRYEDGWSGRQILAHIASIEWTYPRLLDVANQGAPAATSEPPTTVRQTEPEEAAGLRTRQARGGIDAYNHRQVDKRAQASVTDLLAEFRKNRAATIAAVEGADEALLTTPIRSAGGVTGALAGVIYAVAVAHVLGHVNDIVGTQAA